MAGSVSRSSLPFSPRSSSHAPHPAPGAGQAGSRMARRPRPGVEPLHADLHGRLGIRRHRLPAAALLPVRAGRQRLGRIAPGRRGTAPVPANPASRRPCLWHLLRPRLPRRTCPLGASGRCGHPDIARLYEVPSDDRRQRLTHLSNYLAQPAYRQAVPLHFPAARWRHVARDVEPASRRVMPVYASRRDRPADADIADGAVGAAENLDVGPGRAFHTPSAAAAAARQGDVIRIAPGTYEDCAVWRADGLVIEGEDAERVVIGNRTCLGKGVFRRRRQRRDRARRHAARRTLRNTPTAPAFAARA